MTERALALVEKACRELMDSHGLDSWRLKFFDDLRDYAGGCAPGTCTIYISTRCLHEAEDICRHEIAHALDNTYYSHGQEWASRAWRLAGCPPGGTKTCPEPKCMSDLIGGTTFRSLLLAVLKEAKDIGVIEEERSALKVRGGKMSSPMNGYVFYFCKDYGDVVIYTPTGSWHVEAMELQPEIEAAYVAASGSERIAEIVRKTNELMDSLQGASLRDTRRRRTFD